MRRILFILTVTVITLVACSTDELMEQPSNDRIQHEATLILNFSRTGFDDEPTTRAYSNEWTDGSKLYIQFQNNSGTTDGVATYTKASNNWKVTYYGNLSTDDWTQCSVYYFDGKTEANEQTVMLTPQTAVFSDTKGDYLFKDNTVMLNATLRPVTGRLRFAMKYDLDEWMANLKDSLFAKQTAVMSSKASKESKQAQLKSLIASGGDATEISNLAMEIQSLTTAIERDSLLIISLRTDSASLAISQESMKQETLAVSGFQYYSGYDIKSGQLTTDSVVFSKRLVLPITKTENEWYTPYFYALSSYDYLEVQKDEVQRWRTDYSRLNRLSAGSSKYMSIPLDYMHDNWVYYANYSELGSISVTPSVVIPEGGVGELTIRYDFKKQDYFTGYQFGLKLPESISYTAYSPQYLLGECHGSSHWLNYSNRTYYCSSETNETLHGSSGTLLKILIKPGESLHSGDVLLGYFIDPRLSVASCTEGIYYYSNGYEYNVYNRPSTVPFTIVISDPLPVTIEGEYTAKGTSYFDGEIEWTVIIEKDANTPNIVWITGLVDETTTAIYGTINEAKTEISIPGEQQVLPHSTYDILLKAYGWDGTDRTELADGDPLIGKIAEDGTISFPNYWFGGFATNKSDGSDAGWWSLLKNDVVLKKK